MGNIFFRKPLTTFEQLDRLEKSIIDAEEYKKTTQLSQKRYIAYLIIFSSLLYLLAFVVGYFYYYPLTALDIFLRLIPLILFPFIILGLKVLGCWWFLLRLEANEQNLDKVKRQKREILDHVKTKEVYVVAKEILEKFDPAAQLERLKLENKADEEKMKEMEIRQRNTKILTSRRSSCSDQSNDPKIDRLNVDQRFPTAKQLPRPIMPPNRSTFDKLIDYFLADGPENRYALICKSCSRHNGMALLEDIKILSYNCAYCHKFNESASKRLVARLSDKMDEAVEEIDVTSIVANGGTSDESRANSNGSSSLKSDATVTSVLDNLENSSVMKNRNFQSGKIID